MRRALIVLALAVVAATATTSAAADAQAADAPHVVSYRPPVNNAPVIDRFRPPTTPYGRGNRGLEYGTRPGTRVVAAAAGRVTFAGSVAGARYVTIEHADRLRTTYGPLGTIAAGTTVDATVAAGQVIGTAGRRLLFTARLGDDAYLDPAILLAASDPSAPPPVRLVPDPPRPGYALGPAWRPPGRLRQHP